MNPVGGDHDLLGGIEGPELRRPGDFLAVFDSTMARFWFFNDTARQRITDCLVRLSYGRTLTTDELQRFGVHFADGRFGETIFLLNPGVLLSRSDFNGKGWDPAGM